MGALDDVGEFIGIDSVVDWNPKLDMEIKDRVVILASTSTHCNTEYEGV